MQRREQHRFNSQDQDACLRAPSAQVTPVPQFIRPEAERSTTQSEAGQLHQRAQPSREAFNESVMNQTPKMDVVQHVHQHQHDVQQDQSLGLSRQSGRASCTPRLTKFEVVQEEQHQRCQQEHGAETSRQEGSTAVSQQALRVGTVHQGGQTQEHSRHEAESSRQASKFRDTKQCVQSATLQQGEQGQVSHNRPAAEPTKLSVPYAAEGPTQSPGVPLLSPSLGKLSLRSRRSTQSTVSLQSNLQSSQPSQSSLGNVQLSSCPHFMVFVMSTLFCEEKEFCFSPLDMLDVRRQPLLCDANADRKSSLVQLTISYYLCKHFVSCLTHIYLGSGLVEKSWSPRDAIQVSVLFFCPKREHSLFVEVRLWIEYLKGEPSSSPVGCV